MDRRNITDEDGSVLGWFDRDTATQYHENTRWDGHNMVSVATGSQWNHETLYRTKSGRWVLHWTSQWQGSKDTYREIGEEQAHTWLLANGHEKAIPADVLTGMEY